MNLYSSSSPNDPTLRKPYYPVTVRAMVVGACFLLLGEESSTYPGTRRTQVLTRNVSSILCQPYPKGLSARHSQIQAMWNARHMAPLLSPFLFFLLSLLSSNGMQNCSPAAAAAQVSPAGKRTGPASFSHFTLCMCNYQWQVSTSLSRCNSSLFHTLLLQPGSSSPQRLILIHEFQASLLPIYHCLSSTKLTRPAKFFGTLLYFQVTFKHQERSQSPAWYQKPSKDLLGWFFPKSISLESTMYISCSFSENSTGGVTLKAAAEEFPHGSAPDSPEMRSPIGILKEEARRATVICSSHLSGNCRQLQLMRQEDGNACKKRWGWSLYEDGLGTHWEIPATDLVT